MDENEERTVADDPNLPQDPLDEFESSLASPPQVPVEPAEIDLASIPLDEPTETMAIEPDLEIDQAPAELPVTDALPNFEPAAEGSGPSPDLTARLDAMESGLGRKLDALQTAFDREIRAEATREKVVDRLHAELQEYKAGLILGILRPIFLDLIQLHDDIGKMTNSTDPTPEVARLLDTQQAIEDILYRQGVEPFTEEGDTFDPRRQRSLTTVPTDDPTLNKKVAARLRKGFQSGDKVIRPEIVSVYAHKANSRIEL